MKDISQILKADIKIEDGIFCCMNDHFVSGDNQKYMKMYDWMSFFYDFGEKWIGKLKYGNDLPQGIDLKTIDLVGADISMGMLKRCKKQWQKKTNLTLVQCPAEELPFADNMFDIVFHNGGINFFNDKALAMSEMLRVAKPGSKLLIADETADFVETQYKKSVFSKSYFEGKTVDLNAIEQCIPTSVVEKKTESGITSFMESLLEK